MYDIDKKFFNEDGTVNCEAACRAGRKARGRAAGESAEFLKTTISGPVRAASRAISVFAVLFGAQSAR